jgi:hypothetical protein
MARIKSQYYKWNKALPFLLTPLAAQESMGLFARLA